jgi:hypothetical protein
MDNTVGVTSPADGSKHLQPESKWGHSIQLLTTAGALALAGWLTNDLDLSSLPGWSVAVATAAVGTAAGLLTSWAKRNKA